jgi:hypothetical protein
MAKFYPEGTQLYVLHSDITVNSPLPLLLRGGTVVATNKPEIVNHHFRAYDPEKDDPMEDHPYFEDLTWTADDCRRRAEAEGGN